MKLRGKNGATLAGKHDILAKGAEELLLIDCKTGKPHPSDKMQVMLYMLMLSIVGAHSPGLSLSGRVQYKTDVANIDPAAVDIEFQEHVRELMDFAASREQPPTTHSFDESSFCDITLADCTDRQETEKLPISTDLF